MKIHQQSLYKVILSSKYLYLLSNKDYLHYANKDYPILEFRFRGYYL